MESNAPQLRLQSLFDLTIVALRQSVEIATETEALLLRIHQRNLAMAGHANALNPAPNRIADTAHR